MGKGASRGFRPKARVVRRAAAIAGLVAALQPVTPAVAADVFGPASDLPLMFPLLLMTLGPFKLIAPFFRATRGLEFAPRVQMALLAAAFASAMLAVAGFLGENMLTKYGIPVPELMLAGGLILFLSALLNVLQQFQEAPPPAPRSPDAPATPIAQLAMRPLAFPGIVTPYGIAALVVFLSLSPDAAGRAAIAGLVAGIMALNVAAMIATRWLMPLLSIVLPILGAVLGVVQVALGLDIMKVAVLALLHG